MCLAPIELLWVTIESPLIDVGLEGGSNAFLFSFNLKQKLGSKGFLSFQVLASLLIKMNERKILS